MVSVFLYILTRKPLAYSKSAQTRSNIGIIYVEVLNMNCDIKSDLLQSLTNIREEDEISFLLGKHIKNSWVTRSPSSYDLTTDSLFVDGWGNPLCIAWRSDISAKASTSLLKSIDLELLIWSSGPNGINEFGYKDDIIFEMPEVMKQETDRLYFKRGALDEEPKLSAGKICELGNAYQGNTNIKHSKIDQNIVSE